MRMRVKLKKAGRRIQERFGKGLHLAGIAGLAGAVWLLMLAVHIGMVRVESAVSLGSLKSGAEDDTAVLLGSLRSGAEDDATVAQNSLKSGGGDSAVVQTEEMPSETLQSKQVALTFDDGPHPVYTERLLDGLKELGVHATFFVVGKNIPGHEDLIARMDQEGHLIGNHTYDHVKISDMKDADACAQVQKTSDLVREITGKDTEFVRPPFGTWKKTLECSFQMIPVLWSVDPLDWTTKNKSLVVQRILKDTKPGDIILLHDFYESSVEAALEVVKTLLAEGYEFVTVDEMILE